MTLKELIYNFRKLIKDNGSDDLQFSDRHLEFIINYVRVLLVRQEYKKHNRISPNSVQTITVELEPSDPSGSDLLYTGKKILKSSEIFSTFVDGGDSMLIERITGLDGTLSIDIVSQAMAHKKKDLKYASKRPYGYYSRGRIYIVGCPSELRFIKVSAVFENPSDVNKLAANDNCFNVMEDDYPIPYHLIDTLNTIIKEKELNLYFQLVENKVNDGQNNA